MVSVQSFSPNRQIRYGFSLKRPTPTQEIPTTDDWANDWDLGRYALGFACVDLLTDACVFPKPLPPLHLKKHEYNNIFVTSSRSARFYAPFDVSGGRLGLYAGPGKLAEEWCKAVGEIALGEGTTMITSTGYAVDARYTVACSPGVPIGTLRCLDG